MLLQIMTYDYDDKAAVWDQCEPSPVKEGQHRVGATFRVKVTIPEVSVETFYGFFKGNQRSNEKNHNFEHSWGVAKDLAASETQQQTFAN